MYFYCFYIYTSYIKLYIVLVTTLSRVSYLLLFIVITATFSSGFGAEYIYSFINIYTFLLIILKHLLLVHIFTPFSISS